jgi:hypothetical protein
MRELGGWGERTYYAARCAVVEFFSVFFQGFFECRRRWSAVCEDVEVAVRHFLFFLVIKLAGGV